MKLKEIIIPKTRSTRFIELDIVRGFAISLMVFLHILWDLNYFGILPLNKTIYKVNVVCPALFFLLLGVCLAVSTNKSDLNLRKIKHLIHRGVWILTLGMILTVITLLLLPERPILFGVLHCIGFSVILAIPILKIKLNPIPTIILGFFIVAAGLLLKTITFNNPTYLHLSIGLHEANIWSNTIDYFPLMPWFGLCLIGIAIGNILYKDHKRQFSIPDLSQYKPASLFSWMGQHSLIIYLIHQPIIAGILSIYLYYPVF